MAMIFQAITYTAMNFFGANSNTDELGVWVNLSTSVFFAVTIGVLIYATILQRKAIEVDQYGDLREQHQSLILFQIEHSKMLEIFKEVKRPDKYAKSDDDEITLDDHERLIFQFYVAEFDLYERVWILKEERSKLTEYEWMCWIGYLERMSHNWIFRYTFNQTKIIFDSRFMEHIKEKIIDRQDANKDVREALIIDIQNAYKDEENTDLLFPKSVGYPGN